MGQKNIIFVKSMCKNDEYMVIHMDDRIHGNLFICTHKVIRSCGRTDRDVSQKLALTDDNLMIHQ